MHTSPWRLVALPLAAVTVAQLLRAPLVPFIGPQTSPVQMFSFLAVFLAGWAGGLWAGLIAAMLSIAAGYIGFLTEVGGPLTAADIARAMLFMVISLIFSVMSESRLRAERRLAEHAADAKRAATKLRNFAFLVQNASDFIGMSDLEYRPYYVNKAGADLVGLGHAPFRPGVTLFDFVFPEHHQYLREEFFPTVLRDGRATTEVRFKHCVTAAPVWMEYSVVRMDDADGQPIGYATISRDLSERRRKEDALQEADRQKDEFLGILAHELRNPLAPLMYSVAVLERRATDPAMKRPLAIMSRQVHRMTRLVDDLLDVSRVTQRKIALQREPLDVADLVTHAVDAMRPTLERRGHVVDLQIHDHGLRISGDPLRLGQVLENLLGNAAKYTPSGGRVTVTVGRDGSDVVMGVRDTGVGIAPEMLRRVFELFVQADTSLDRSEGGLGIGLTLVDRLTRLHGGRVDARSDGPGRGSEFILRLPLLSAAVAASTAPSTNRAATQEGRRILIVDDNTDSAEALAQLLEMNGHRVRVVLDGRDAADRVRDFNPDLVLLDIGLPGKSGFDIVREIRSSADLASLTVVATTGFGRDEDRARSIAAGFNHHLTKPIQITDVEEIIASASA